MGFTVRAKKRKRIAAGFAAVLFCVAVLTGMEYLTVDSRKPELEHFSELPAQQLRAHGFDMFSLAKASPAHVASIASVPVETAAQWVETAQLATLRGMGSENLKNLRTLGVRSMRGLAAADWRVIDGQLEQLTGRDVVDARVRVWIRGARQTLSPGS